MIQRRNEKAAVGFVNFPSDRIESSGEGGVVVKLLVLDDCADYQICCGDNVIDIQVGETFLGFAGKKPPEMPDPSEFLAESAQSWDEAYDKYRGKHKKYMEKGFFLSDGGWPDHTIPCKAVIVMGATGWSAHWVCQFKDLTPEGQALVSLLRSRYPDATFLLATFLDT